MRGIVSLIRILTNSRYGTVKNDSGHVLEIDWDRVVRGGRRPAAAKRPMESGNAPCQMVPKPTAVHVRIDLSLLEI